MMTAKTKKQAAVAVILVAILVVVALLVYRSLTRTPTVLLVSFHESERRLYSGCYRRYDDNSYNQTTYYNSNDNPRFIDSGAVPYHEDARLIYSKDDHFWFLSYHESGKKELAYSEVTDSSNIVSVFDKNWSATTTTGWSGLENRDISVDFLLLNEDDNRCSLLGDGVCHDSLNTPQYGYDIDDCCSTICRVGPDCAAWEENITIFGTNTNGIYFSSCVDPSMKEVTIRLDEFSSSYETNNLDLLYPFRDKSLDHFFDKSKKVQSSTMTITCKEGSTRRRILEVDIDKTMTGKTQTIRIPEGVLCTMDITWPTHRKFCTKDCYQTQEPFWVFRYTFYNGPSADDNNMMLTFSEYPFDSSTTTTETFWRIPETLLEAAKFDSVRNSISNVYANETAMNTFRWMEKESKECEDDSFARRFYLFSVLEAVKGEDVKGQDFVGAWDFLESVWWVSEALCSSQLNMFAAKGGFIPESIGKLQHLDDLRILGYSFGSIATQIGQLTQLTSLTIAKSKAPLPTEIGELTELVQLNTECGGSIPTEIGKLTKLAQMDLSSDGLIGPIPTEIGKLTQLTHISFIPSKISGSIPTEIGNLSLLKFLSFRDTNLSGSIPTEIGNLSKLKSLKFQNVDITGSIPTEIGKLVKLRTLTFRETAVTGSIPTEIGRLSKLTTLSFFGDPGVDGNLPIEIAQCIRLQCLRLDGTSIRISQDLYDIMNIALEDYRHRLCELPEPVRALAIEDGH